MSDYKGLLGTLRNIGKYGTNNNALVCPTMLRAADAIEQLVKERDAAVADLQIDKNCDFCKWSDNGDCIDFEHEECHGEYWEWRGVQDE